MPRPLEPMLSGAAQLLKPDTGELVIVSSSRQSIDELITRFYSHQRTYELYTAETVLSTLDKLGVKYTVGHETVTFDLTQQFQGNFQSEKALMVLDHLVFTRLQDYPPQVAKYVWNIWRQSQQVMVQKELLQQQVT